MASPQSPDSQGEPSDPKKLEQITFRFCSECSNMLYPKEDEEAHVLQFVCRTCQFTEEAASTCVFRNVLNSSAGETAGVTQDVGSDPTVSELPPVVCLHCGTIISCGGCSQPASAAFSTKSGPRRDGHVGIAHFVLQLAAQEDADPFAEYDEEPENMMDIVPDEGYATSDSSRVANGHSRHYGHSNIVEWHGRSSALSSDGHQADRPCVSTAMVVHL